MDAMIRVQILDETVGNLYCTNTFGKGMCPVILPLAMNNLWGKMSALTLIEQPI